MITDFFDRTYIINLPHRKDRLLAVTSELKRNGIHLTPGKIEVFPGITPDNRGGFTTVGARGCFLSHLQILKQAKKDGLKNVLIIEDDLILSRHWKQNEAYVIDILKHVNWDIVFFGHRIKCSILHKFNLQPYTQPIITCHFYALNSSVFDRMIAFLELILSREPGDPRGGPMHYDGAMSTLRLQDPGIVTLIACPSLGMQGSSKSDIYEENILDKLLLFGPFIALIRKLKRTLSRIFYA